MIRAVTKMRGGDFTFDEEFRELTGFTPLSWQRRLFEEHFAASGDPARDTLPHALDIPTGLGKTSVMAIWLLARAHPDEAIRRKVPRRLADESTGAPWSTRRLLRPRRFSYTFGWRRSAQGAPAPWDERVASNFHIARSARR